MLKRKTLCAAALVLIFIFAATAPSEAQAAWFGEKLTASIFSAVSSFFQKVFSPNKSASDASCIPPVSPKPNGEQHSYGTMTVTPAISQASADNTITISLNTHTNALSIDLHSLWSDVEVIDWGPKQPELNGGKGINITQISYGLKWDTYKYSDDNKQIQERPRLHAQKYWIKFKVPRKTVTDRSDHDGKFGSYGNFGSYGWKEVKYRIGYAVGDVEGENETNKEIKYVSGKDFFYVGGPQYPVGEIVRAGANVKSPSVRPANSLVTVKAGEPFEIEAKPTGWQGGVMTLVLPQNDRRGNSGRIIGSDTFTVKAGESAIWKVLPTGPIYSPVVRGYVSFTNNCDRFFVHQDSIVGTVPRDTKTDSFDLGIKFDFKGLAKENAKLDLHGGVVYALGFGKPNTSFDITPALSLMDGKDIVARVPDFTLELQAVYKDNPQEIVKSVLITPKGKAQQAGSATALTNKDGEAIFKITAPNVTKEQVTRGILLKASAPDIAGLTSETKIVFTGVTIEITKPQTPKTPTSELETTSPPPPPPQTPKASVKSLIVSADKVVPEITEGDTIIFTAKLVMSDGSTQIATDKVVWTVIGKIGSVTPAGIFKAKLDESIAEYGEGFGFVTATYTDSTGNSFLGQSSMIRVKTFIPQEGELQG